MRSHHRSIVPAALATVTAAAALSSRAGAAIQAIYTDISTSPTSLIPLGPQLGITARFIAFGRPYASPDGTRWILQADSNLAASENHVVIVFNSSTASTVLREGVQAPWAAAGETSGVFRRNMGINNAGQFAFGVNTSAATADDYIVKWDGANYVVIAQDGGPVPGVAGETHSDNLDGAHILNNGTVGYTSISTNGALPTTQDGFCFLGTTIVQQEGTIPPGQGTTPSLPWETFTQGDYYHSADGAHYVVNGNLTGTLDDDVLVVDGTVVLQEGFPVPPLMNVIITGGGNIAEPQMAPNGDWFCRGTNFGGQDWIVRNGSVIAATGLPILPGSGEHYSESVSVGTFFFMQGNGNGRYVIGGGTDSANLNANSVLVLDGQRVIARRNDPVDVNGNGINDDNTFIESFRADSGFLTPAGVLYFVADLRNGSGIVIGEGFLKLNLNLDCPADIVSNGSVDVNDLLAVITTWGACPAPCPPCAADIAPAGGNCVVNVNDLLAVISTWGACP